MKQTLVVALAFVGVFLSGAVVGGLVVARVGPKVRHEKVAEQYALQNLKQMGQVLDLTPEQIQKIRPLLQKAGTEINKLRRQNQGGIAEIGEKLEAEIKPILTEPQRVKYEEMRLRRKDREKRWQDYMKAIRSQRGGEPPPPPPPADKVED